MPSAILASMRACPLSDIFTVAHDTGLVYIDMNKKMQGIITSIRNNAERQREKAERMQEEMDIWKKKHDFYSSMLEKYSKINKNGNHNADIVHYRMESFRTALRLSFAEDMYKSYKETEMFWRNQEKYILEEAEAV